MKGPMEAQLKMFSFSVLSVFVRLWVCRYGVCVVQSQRNVCECVCMKCVWFNLKGLFKLCPLPSSVQFAMTEPDKSTLPLPQLLCQHHSNFPNYLYLFTVAHFNVHSLLWHTDKFHITLETEGIILVSEKWLKPSISNDTLKLPE